MKSCAAVLLSAVLAVAAWPAASQSTPRPRPPGTAPLDEAPPPPPLAPADAVPEPQVTIRKDGETTYEEYRIKGRLYMVKITPSHGKPYYLIDQGGKGQFARHDNLDPGVRVPQWVLVEF